MPKAIGYINRITGAATPQELWDITCEALLSYEFDRISYGISNADKSMIQPENLDLIFFMNFEWPDPKIARDPAYFMRTPLFRWVRENAGTCSWAWTDEAYHAGRLTPDEVESYLARIRMGFPAGYTISIFDPSFRGRGVFSISAKAELTQADTDELWQKNGAEIEAICHVTHLRMRSLPLPVRRRPLSPRQKEALDWVAEGKTMQDIAAIMGISPAMVEKHLKLVRDALDVETTAQAIAKAAALNQLFTNGKNYELIGKNGKIVME